MEYMDKFKSVEEYGHLREEREIQLECKVLEMEVGWRDGSVLLLLCEDKVVRVYSTEEQ